MLLHQNQSAGLLDATMKQSSSKKFLIDGFPRAMDQVHGYQEWFGRQGDAVLFFACTEDVMTERIMARGQGRADDNPETLQKRLAKFRKVSMPVIEWYRGHTDLLKTVDANRSLEEVAADVDAYISGLEGATSPCTACVYCAALRHFVHCTAASSVHQSCLSCGSKRTCHKLSAFLST